MPPPSTAPTSAQEKEGDVTLHTPTTHSICLLSLPYTALDTSSTLSEVNAVYPALLPVIHHSIMQQKNTHRFDK